MEYVNGSKAARGRNETYDGRHGRVTERLMAASAAPSQPVSWNAAVLLRSLTSPGYRCGPGPWSLNP